MLGFLALGWRLGDSAPWALAGIDGSPNALAVRTPRWKWYEGRLYDLVADPGQGAGDGKTYAPRRARDERDEDDLDRGGIGNAQQVAQTRVDLSRPEPERRRQRRPLGLICQPSHIPAEKRLSVTPHRRQFGT